MAYEKNGFKTSDAYDLAYTLIGKVSALATALDSGSTATSVDGLSAQTWYGVPEAIADDLNQAIDLINLINKKVYSALV